MRSHRRALRGVLVAVAVLAPGSFLPSARADPIFTNAFQDNPLGHLFINTVNATPVGSNLVFQVTFHNPITDPSDLSAPDHTFDLFGFIDIDTDKNPLTPTPPPDLVGQRGTGGFPGLGVDFYVDLGSVLSHPGSVDVVDTANGFALRPASIAYAASAVTITVPLSSLPGSKGLVNYGVIAVDGGPPGGSAFVSDLAPDGTFAFDVAPGAVGVPEPGSAALLCLGLAAAGVSLRRGHIRCLARSRPRGPGRLSASRT